MNAFLRGVIAVLVGLSVGLCLTMIGHENPFHIAGILYRSAFGSAYDIGMTLFYSMPLFFTGLSVSIAFRVGLFNVGAEGQLLLGSLAAAAVGGLFPELPAMVGIPLAVVAAMLAGGAWAGIAGWLKTRRGTHEVISTILLNYIAAGLASYITLYVLNNPDSQNPETLSVGAHYLLRPFAIFDKAPVTHALTLALVALLIWQFVETRTQFGFKLKAVGENSIAAEVAGYSVARIRLQAMLWSGAFAGLVSVVEILGNTGRFRPEFSPGFGFTGIAVALLSRGNAFGILGSALLFGALHKGALDLDLETKTITHDLAIVLQALVILAVSVERFKFWKTTRKVQSQVVST